MIKKNLSLLCVFISSATAVFAGEIETKEVKYQFDGKDYVGFVAWDKSQKGKRPGVLVVHEWWGHNDYSRRRAQDLAKLGYVGFALDMYGDGKTADHPKKAGEMAGAALSNMENAVGRFKAAMSTLQENEWVDSSKLAAIGYCFGGGVVLEMARRGLDLKAVASFHGSLASNYQPKKGEVKAKIFVANGGSDPMVTKEQIATFKKQMKTAGVDFKFQNYPGALHAFTNPAADENGKKFKLPLAYHKKADLDSWNRMKKLFQRVL